MNSELSCFLLEHGLLGLNGLYGYPLDLLDPWLIIIWTRYILFFNWTRIARIERIIWVSVRSVRSVVESWTLIVLLFNWTRITRIERIIWVSVRSVRSVVELWTLNYLVFYLNTDCSDWTDLYFNVTQKTRKTQKKRTNYILLCMYAEPKRYLRGMPYRFFSFVEKMSDVSNILNIPSRSTSVRKPKNSPFLSRSIGIENNTPQST